MKRAGKPAPTYVGKGQKTINKDGYNLALAEVNELVRDVLIGE